MEDRTALITGASAGIGAALARFLAGKGLRVVLVARREDRLEALASEIKADGGLAQVVAADLSREDERVALFEQICRGNYVDLLINNAGFGWYGYYSDMPWDTARRMLAVNVSAMAHLTSLCLPGMLNRRRGHIINIGSIAGGFSNQGVALYSSSKAFMDAFSTALHRELRGSGVHASVMRLGPVRTDFFDAARRLENGGSIPAERWAVPVERVNRALWRLLEKPRRVVYLPGWLWISQLADPLLGGLIDRLGPLLLRRSGKRG
jgi:hypothetical protein